MLHSGVDGEFVEVVLPTWSPCTGVLRLRLAGPVGDEDILHYYPLAKTQQKNGPSGPVLVGRRPCEPHNLTLLSLGGGNYLKKESHPSPIGLVFLGDWAFS